MKWPRVTPATYPPFLWMNYFWQQRKGGKCEMPHCDSHAYESLRWPRPSSGWCPCHSSTLCIFVTLGREGGKKNKKQQLVMFSHESPRMFVNRGWGSDWFFLNPPAGEGRKNIPRVICGGGRRGPVIDNACYLTQHTDLLLTRTGLYLQHQCHHVTTVHDKGPPLWPKRGVGNSTYNMQQHWIRPMDLCSSLDLRNTRQVTSLLYWTKVLLQHAWMFVSLLQMVCRTILLCLMLLIHRW